MLWLGHAACETHFEFSRQDPLEHIGLKTHHVLHDGEILAFADDLGVTIGASPVEGCQTSMEARTVLGGCGHHSHTVAGGHCDDSSRIVCCLMCSS